MYKQGRQPRVIAEGQSAVCCALWKYSLVNNQILSARQHHTCGPDGSDNKYDMTNQDRRIEGAERHGSVWFPALFIPPGKKWKITFMLLPLLQQAVLERTRLCIRSHNLIKLPSTYLGYIL